MKKRYCLVVTPRKGSSATHYFDDPYDVKAFIEGIDTMHQFTVENMTEVLHSVDLYRSEYGLDYKYAETVRSFCEGEYVREPIFINPESDRVETQNDLYDLWNEEETLREEYPSFQDFVRACQASEGGVLEAIR